MSCPIHNFTLLPDQEDEWEIFVIPAEIWLFFIKAVSLRADLCCRIKNIEPKFNSFLKRKNDVVQIKVKLLPLGVRHESVQI